jgi:hypothetical protein
VNNLSSTHVDALFSGLMPTLWSNDSGLESGAGKLNKAFFSLTYGMAIFYLARSGAYCG